MGWNQKAQLGKSFCKEVQLNSPRQSLSDSESLTTEGSETWATPEIHFSIYKGQDNNTVDAKGSQSLLLWNKPHAGQLAYGPTGLPGTLNINKNQTSILKNTKDTYR